MMGNPTFLALLGLIASNFLIGVVEGLDGWTPDKFGRLYYHSSIVVDDTVYIVGGELHLQDGNDVHFSAMDSTLSIPLQKSWTNSSVEIKAKQYPSGFPYLNSQSLWWDPKSKSVYSYGGGTTIAGGEGTDTVDPLSVWAFSPDSNSWDERYGPDDDLWDTMTRATRCASAYTPKSGYCLGGYSGPWSTDVDTPSSNIPLGGMVEFDFETTTWSNVSSIGSSQSGWTISQRMEYVPSYGEKGILVTIGGHDLDVQEHPGDGKSLRSMSNITLYDIHTKTWHSQTATGDIPDGRSKFCSVSAQGGDNDTYEIFVFGGTDGRQLPKSSDSDQVYVLSLPAFRWFRTPAVTEPRSMHTCEVVGGRQMLSIGGAHAEKSETVDSFTHGLGIFDLVDWEWKPSYDAQAAPYQPANTVKQFYEKNSKYPEWDSDGTQALISGSTDPTSDSEDSEPPESSAGAKPEPTSSSDSDTPVGPIVGGVVGGVNAIAITVALIIFLLRRKRKKRDASQGPKELDVPPESRIHTRTPKGGPGELDSTEPYPLLKENNHPRNWNGRVKELEGDEGKDPNELEAGRRSQEYHRGQPVRVPQRAVTELES